MKPPKRILFFSTLFIFIKCYPQENKWFAGFKAGVNYSTTSFEYIDDVNYKIGICTGLNFGYKIHKNILLLIETVYDQQGCKIPIEFTDETGNPLGNGTLTYAFNYATIPFSINYSPGDKNTFEAGIGIDNSFLLSAHSKVPNLTLQGQPMDNTDIKEAFKSYEPGVFIRAAGTLYFTSNLGLLFEGRYSRGITNINKNSYLKIMNSGFFLGAGLRFYFFKKAE